MEAPLCYDRGAEGRLGSPGKGARLIDVRTGAVCLRAVRNTCHGHHQRFRHCERRRYHASDTDTIVWRRVTALVCMNHAGHSVTAHTISPDHRSRHPLTASCTVSIADIVSVLCVQNRWSCRLAALSVQARARSVTDDGNEPAVKASPRRPSVSVAISAPLAARRGAVRCCAVRVSPSAYRLSGVPLLLTVVSLVPLCLTEPSSGVYPLRRVCHGASRARPATQAI